MPIFYLAEKPYEPPACVEQRAIVTEGLFRDNQIGIRTLVRFYRQKKDLVSEDLWKMCQNFDSWDIEQIPLTRFRELIPKTA